MSLHRRQLLSNITSLIILASMVMTLVSPDLFTNNLALAQESTEEPAPDPVEPTAEPTEPAPTDTPPAEVTEEVTIEPADSPTQPPDTVVPPTEEPVDPTLFYEDFEDGSTAAWLLSEGWSLVDAGQNVYLSASTPNQTAAINGLLWDHLALSAQIGITADNTALFAVRVSKENYAASIDAAGNVKLYRGQQLVAEGAYIPFTTEDDAEPTAPAPDELVWYDVSLSAINDTITVSVNEQPIINFVDPQPLPGGAVVFATGATNSGPVALDEIVVQQIAGTPIPTATPEDDETIVIPPAPTDEAEPTEEVEVTEEVVEDPTVEPEITEEVEITEEPEVTEEAEVTEEPEATEEPAPEATEEPEPEVTAEPEPEATPEVEEPEATEEPAPEGPTPVLFTDFTGDLDGWSLSESATITHDEDASTALLTSGDTLRPSPVLFLADTRIEAVVSLIGSAESAQTADEGDDEAAEVTEEPEATEEPAPANNGLSVVVRSSEGKAYRVVFHTNGVDLYRLGADGSELVTSAPGAYPAGEWFTLNVAVEADTVTVSVDDAVALTFTDETPLLAGELALVANSGAGVLLDSVAVYDLNPGAEVEPTPVPYSLDDVREKFDGVLARLLENQLSGDSEAVDAIAEDFFLLRDDEGRFRLILNVEPGSSQAIADAVTARGGENIYIEPNFVDAYVPLAELVALAHDDDIRSVNLPDRVVPTSPMLQQDDRSTPLGTGTVVPHSLDIIGANAWHQAGALGQGVQIAVIDAGFGTTVGNDADRACLVSGAGTGSGDHGTNVVELICDIAPQAQVHAYSVETGSDISTHINAAVEMGRDLIVITVDHSSNIDTAINDAVAAGVPVIAAAGNTGSGPLSMPSSTGGFYFPGGTEDFAVTASAGSTITYSWDDPTGDTNYPSVLSLDGVELDSRTNRGSESFHQYLVPSVCGESCNLTLTVSGEAPTFLEIRVAGGRDENEVSSTSGLERSQIASLTFAAMHPDTIAVGAVCADQESGYPLWSGSPSGGVSGFDTKPNIVAPTGVATSVAGAPIFDQEYNCNLGFSGTSAAASHVAGMSALLLSNPNAGMSNYFNFDTPNRLKRYLMTRTVDLGDPGFDGEHGAGLVQLGNPNFNMNAQTNYSGQANTVIGNAVYVGSVGATTGSPDGTPSNPYIHAREAIQAAISGGQDYVVFQPGEYVTPFVIETNDLTLASYDAVDTADRLPSNFWVNNVTAGDFAVGGIVINNADNVAVRGFNFTGSNPSYLYTSPAAYFFERTVPIAVDGSTEVEISDNRFTRFNRPVEIVESDDVRIINNRFGQFNIRFTGTLTQPSTVVPDFDAAVLRIMDSGQASSVLVENNLIYESSVQRYTATDIRQSIVAIERSGVNIYGSRFVHNQAPSVITINQWQTDPLDLPGGIKNAFPVTIFSSVFDSNVLPAAQTPERGPLVHLYQGPEFRFVNNTIANHFTEHNQYNALITIGYSGTLFSHVSDHNFDIHNNLFYRVKAARLLGVHPQAADPNPNPGGNPIPVTLECNSNDGGSDNGAQNNWFLPVMAGGICQSSIVESGVILNNNILTPTWNGQALTPVDDPGKDLLYGELADATFFGGADPYGPNSFDPDNPYRLLPYDVRVLGEDQFPPIPPTGVDMGWNGAVTEIFGEYNFDYSLDQGQPLDAFGTPRIIDRTDPFTDLENCTFATCLVDIGAYELGEPDPVEIISDPFQIDGLEDTVISFRLDENVRFGFRPYSYTFDQNNLPLFYDTDPNSVCGGQPITYNPETRIVSYCPPPNFHTNYPGAEPIRLGYTVEGLLSTGTDSGVVEITVQPVNDGFPGEDLADAPQVVFAASGETINYRLRPFFDLTPPVVSFSDSDSVDYPFTFSSFAVPENTDGEGGQLFTGGQLTTAIANATATGNFVITAPQGVRGRAEITYLVTDGFGDQAARRLRIIVVDRLAGPGIHDDVSLNFSYSGSGWNPVYYAPAYNNTLHYTANNGDSVDFFFTGDAFNIHMLGYPGGGSYSITIDPDDTGPLNAQPYQDFDALECSIPSKPANISTNSATGQTVTFGCRGLDDIPGARAELRRLTITKTSGSPIYLDAVSVRGQGLPPGSYTLDDFAFSGSPAFTTPNWVLSGGTYYTQNPGTSVRFTVDGDRVDQMAIRHHMGSIFGNFQILVNGQIRQTVNAGRAEFGLNQYAIIGGIGGGLQQIEIRNTENKWMGIQGVELYRSDTPLQPGVSHLPTNANVQYIGSWASENFANTIHNTVRYNISPTGGAIFRIDGQGVALRRTQGFGGSFEVCVSNTCQTFNNASFIGNVGKQTAAVYASTPGPHTVIIRSNSGYIGLEAIEVQATRPTLTAGIYQENHPGISSNGLWTTWANAAGSTLLTNAPGAQISFQVDASTFDNLIISYPAEAFIGFMQACVGSTCTTQPSNTSGAWVIEKDQLGLNDQVATVTISRAMGEWIGFESLQLVP